MFYVVKKRPVELTTEQANRYLVIGIVLCLVLFIGFSAQSIWIKTHCLKADGQVIKIEPYSTGVSFPQIGYTDQKGVNHVFLSRTYSFLSNYSVGKKVKILYNSNADKAYLDDFTVLWSIPIIAFLFGCFLIWLKFLIYSFNITDKKVAQRIKNNPSLSFDEATFALEQENGLRGLKLSKNVIKFSAIGFVVILLIKSCA